MTVKLNQHSTIAEHSEPVRRAIMTMRERFDEPLSLQDMADAASLSPYHFNRIFRRCTGITPGNFLCAIRLKEAQRLLLTTNLRAIDICFEIGYNSPTTFTRRFTQLSGLSPTQFRDLTSRGSSKLGALAEYSRNQISATGSSPGLTGRVSISSSTSGHTFVGLFSTAIPQGRPVGCASLTAPGLFHISAVPNGRYHVFALSFAPFHDPLGCLVHDRRTLHVGMSQSPVTVHGNQVDGLADIVLRPINETDPPILTAIPLLLPSGCPVEDDSSSP